MLCILFIQVSYNVYTVNIDAHHSMYAIK